MLLADRRIYESFAVVEAGTQSDLDVREALAVALGHIGDSRGRGELETMLVGPHARLRHAAAFSLGQLGLEASWPILNKVVGEGDETTAIWTVDALARSGAELEALLRANEDMALNELWGRLLPYLFRYPSEQTLNVARTALTMAPPKDRAQAAYTLARNPILGAAPVLRGLLEDPDPWVRGWAARALGTVGMANDLAAMRPLLVDPEAGPTIHALRSARSLISTGRAAPPDDWRARLIELIDDERPGVAVTAVSVAGAWLLDDRLGDVLVRIANTGLPYYRDLAVAALVEGDDARGHDLVYRYTLADDPSVRALAAQNLVKPEDRQIVRELFRDPVAEVRIAALETLLDQDFDGRNQIVAQALEDSDPAVVGTAFTWLVSNPVLPAEVLSKALADQGGNVLIEVRLYATQALIARGRSEPLERGLVVRNLETLAAVGDFPGRRSAADGLAELGRDRPAIAPAETRKTTANYADVLLLMDEPRTVEIETTHGAIRVRLQCPVTPLTCLNFLQLTNQGFYDGLRFHRVIPDFVAQGGDPRGDGWGGPGYTIRDELNRLPFDRGVIGMASAGADTAGSQFFLTLSRQPHLDGLYTAFGEVVAGMEHLDSIVQGDRILSVKEVP